MVASLSGPSGSSAVQQRLGIRGRQREQVDYLQQSKAPVAGESNAPANGGVVAHFVRRGRVEHDEQDAAVGRADAPCQEVAIPAVARENGGSGGAHWPRYLG